MENIFQAVGYLIFRNRWVLWNMKHGLKTALFVNEVEIDMQRGKQERAQATFDSTSKELETLRATPLKDALLELAPEDRDDQTKVAEMITRIREEREGAIKGLEDQMKTAQQELSLSDGELGRIYGITYGNRMKYDFVKNYKLRKSYSELE